MSKNIDWIHLPFTYSDEFQKVWKALQYYLKELS